MLKGFISKVAAVAMFATILTPINLSTVIANAETETVNIQILATSDLHGKFMPYDYALNATDTTGSLTQISTKVNQLRNPNTILVDNGDIIQGNSSELSLNSNPQVMIKGFNEMGYDAITLGNHEFNYGVPMLQHVMSNATASVLCANLYDMNNNRFYSPYKIIQKAGVRVAIIGVVTPNITRWDSEYLKTCKVTNPVDEVNAAITELKGKADVIVVSYHAGETAEYDYVGSGVVDLLNSCKGVDAVIAAHEHKLVGSKDNQVSYNGVKVVENLPTGQTLAQLNIKVTKQADGTFKVNDRVKDVQTDVISVKNGVSDATLEASLKSYHDEAIADAETPIGTLKGGDLVPADEIKGIPTSQTQETAMIKLINDVQKYYAGTDISAAAAFSSTANIKEGTIRKCDTSLIYKYANTLYKLEMTGKQLKQYMEWSAQFYNTYKDGDLTLSFNEKIRGYNYDMFSGVNYDVDVTKPLGERIVNLKKADGTAINDGDKFTIAVNNYRATSQLSSFGSIDPITGLKSTPYTDPVNDTLPTILAKDVKIEIGGVRELIGDYVKNVKGGTITPELENNWKVIGANWNPVFRAEAVKAINAGKINIPTSVDGRTANVAAVTYNMLATVNNYKNVDILSINDFHGTLLEDPKGKNVGASKLVTAVKEYKTANPNTVVVSAGDNYQGSALSNLLKGKPVSDMLKEMGVEVSAIGNHEYDWGTDLFSQWEKDGNLEFLASNIYDKTTGAPVSYAKPYKIVAVNGLKIAFIGLTTPETAFKTKPENVSNLDFKDPAVSAKYWTEYLKSGKAGETVDAVVALTHLGSFQNSTTKAITGEAADLANANTGVDAIISAHTHNTVAGVVNGTPIVQGYYNGRNLAKLSFVFDSSNKIVAVTPTIDNLAARKATIAEDTTIKTVVDKYNTELQPILGEKIGYTDIELSHDKIKEGVSVLGKWTTDIMRKITNTQIAITNGGGLRAPIAQGDITVGDLYTVMPFDNTFVNMKLTGAGIKKALENGIGNTSIGSVQYSGVIATVDLTRPFGDRITALTLEDGTPLDMAKEYTVTTNDFMFTGGDGYNFSGATGAVDTGLAIRDGIISYLRAQLNPIKIDDEHNGGNGNGVVVGGGNGSTITESLPQTGSNVDMTVLLAIGAMITLAGVGALKLSKKSKKTA
ncbi:multifunctional 2',3'-cyclic-nucleotide 2'-phosphodiesterase/3'-nucleotidase/5'-nucleotidase [Clostridium cellulovorans]|nr:multifunctional 2',3'-cyclic-nucleotide 2'-phosphodiesterase/3'-nucleotidase/5'-nucleotidase [Clostridium cellulovorans]